MLTLSCGSCVFGWYTRRGWVENASRCGWPSLASPPVCRVRGCKKMHRVAVRDCAVASRSSYAHTKNAIEIPKINMLSNFTLASWLMCHAVAGTSGAPRPMYDCPPPRSAGRGRAVDSVVSATLPALFARSRPACSDGFVARPLNFLGKELLDLLRAWRSREAPRVPPTCIDA